MRLNIIRTLAAASLAAALAAPSADAFQPRTPAPIQPGAIHAIETSPAHAAPAVRPVEEHVKEPAKAAPAPAPAKAPAHVAAAPAPVAAPAPAPAHDMHAAPAAAAAPAQDAHAASPAGGHGDTSGPVYPVEVLKALLEGNKRYAASKLTTPNCDASRRAEVAQGQHPVAIVVSCSDSRVPPELVFDQGIGDLFVVRTAGEVVDDVALGSIEYAVEHLHAKLILVLGHERCGAVAATLAGGEAPGHVGKIVEMIRPAVEKAKDKEGDKLTNSVNANVKLVAEKIRSAEPIISEHVKDGTVRVVGGFYDLDTGLVSIIYSPDVSL